MHQFKTTLGGAGFYGVLALCVAAAGIGGYFLLRGPAEDPVEEPPYYESVVREVEPPAAEVVSPAPMPESEPAPAPAPVLPVSMPEAEIDDTPVAAEAPHLIVSPLSGDVVAAFSMDALQFDPTLEDWRTHDGIDIAASAGTTVMAASAGTVLSVRDDPMMGTTVVLSHDGGYQTTYASLQSKPDVAQGDTVSAGQIIGAVGTTAAAENARAAHLHFSVSQDGDSVDPQEFLKK